LSVWLTCECRQSRVGIDRLDLRRLISLPLHQIYPKSGSHPRFHGDRLFGLMILCLRIRFIRKAVPTFRSDALDPAENAKGENQRQNECYPEMGIDQSEPGQMDEGAAQQRDEQPVAAGRFDGEDADSRVAAR
jgi:hypothetical protein